jgi:hypothetical protein
MARKYEMTMDAFGLLMFVLTALLLLGAMETVVVGTLAAFELLGTTSQWRLPSRGDSPGVDTAMSLANAAFVVGHIFVGCIVPYLAVVVVGLRLEWLPDVTAPMAMICGLLGATALVLAAFSGLAAPEPDCLTASSAPNSATQGRSADGGRPSA